jgi:hypothetical protein
MSFGKLSLLLPLLSGAVVDAITPAFHRHAHKMSQLAMQGLNPDGTHMEFSPEIHNMMLKMGATASPSATIPEELVSLPLDHFGNDNRTYKNQYWVSDSSYKKGGPVFVYDGGEGDIAGSVDFVLTNSTSFFKQIVDEFNGIGIVWQHRYYGDSTPFKISLDTPTSELQWLTSEQALADVPAFAANFSRDDIDYDLTPEGTPWVFVGGSYPGMRAAFSRHKYPESIFASFASSAPVEARNDMSIYFDPIPKGLKQWGWGNCSADITAAIKHIDTVLEDDQAAAALKIKFLGRNAEKNTNAEFGDALSTIFWYWQSYGVDAGSAGLSSFCNYIETDATSNQTAPAEGWAPTKGAAYVVNRWAEWPVFASLVSSSLETKCEGSKKTNGTAPECDLGLKFDAPASIAWTFQYCTEWGFLQSANLGEDQIISKYNSLQHQHDICHRQFDDASAAQFVPDWPATEKTNDYFGGWEIRPSNVYWSGGQFDPWRTLSPLSDEPFAIKPEMTQTPPKCGEETPVNQIFGYVMENACHCFDFRTYFPGGAISRKYFTTALRSWLPCFGQ